MSFRGTRGKYELTLLKFLPSSEKEWVKADFALLEAASNIDRTRDQLARDAEYLSRKFAEFATEVGSNMPYVTTPPTSCSSLNDVTANARVLQVAQDSFLVLLGAVHGFEIRKAFLAVLRT